MAIKASSSRLQYLDWVRGLAAVTMLHGHVWDSFLRDDLRSGGPYILSQFLGGMPPAIFLFLTGVTLAFLMDSSEKKGLGPRERMKAAFQRSGYLFFLAFAFRIQAWIFGIPAPWQDLFRVDVLNCMGFSIALLSTMAIFRTAERARLCAVLALGVAFASPLVSQLNWSGVPWMIRGYLIPDQKLFGFFPWGAYLAFGVATGSAIRLIPEESMERAMQWAAIIGGVTILACQYFASLPFSIYTKSEFWLNSPAQVLTKQGVTMVILAIAFLWTRFGAREGWSWVRQFGTTSLLVYWVHIEMVYGRGLFFLKNRLTEWQTMIAAILVILLMLAISVIKTRWTEVRARLHDWGVWRLPKQESAST
jgi:peptidoglycan/LPS O-acetylase OafA/YrhL